MTTNEFTTAKKQFTVEILSYPQSFRVMAENKNEAIREAKAMYLAESNGAGIYAIESVEETE